MTQDNHPHFSKWEIVLIFISILVSIASLYFSIYSFRKSEKLASTPNIQVKSANGSRYHNVKDSVHSSLNITSEIILENVGSAPTQIINVEWEAIQSGDSMAINDPWLALSDTYNPNSVSRRTYFYQNRINPILGILNKTIGAGETKMIKMAFFAKNVLSANHNIPAIRLKFIFNNGEERTIIPLIEIGGAGGDMQ